MLIALAFALLAATAVHWNFWESPFVDSYSSLYLVSKAEMPAEPPPMGQAWRQSGDGWRLLELECMKRFDTSGIGFGFILPDPSCVKQEVNDLYASKRESYFTIDEYFSAFFARSGEYRLAGLVILMLAAFGAACATGLAERLSAWVKRG